MKKIILPAIILISAVSCNNSQPDKDISIIPKTAGVNSADSSQIVPLPASGASLTADMPRTVVQATPAPQQLNTPTPGSALLQTTAAVKTVAGLNPAHGQPGHRCDITPGAPLSSSPAPKPQAPSATITQPTQIQGQRSAVNPAIAVNPPHGQPGHKCDVGANSNLSTGSSVTMSKTAPSLQGLPIMQQNNSPAPSVISSGGTGKLNPAHGQPGHDCKVSVGQPLK